MSPSRTLCVVLAVAALAASALAEDPKPAALPPELSWVPADSVAFLQVRPGELWNSQAGTTMREAFTRDDPEALGRVERALGVRLGQVERLTLLVPAAAGDTPEESVVVRVTTAAPYDRTAVLNLLGVKKSPLANIAQLPGSGGLVRFSDPTNLTYAFGRERSVSVLSRLERKGEPGRLAPAMKLAAEKHLLVGAIDIGKARQLSWLASDSSLRPFFVARTAVLVGDLTPRGLELTLRLNCGLRVHAEEVAEALASRREGAPAALADGVRSATRDKEPGRARVLDGLLAGLKGARVERRDRDIILTATLPSADVLALLAVDAVDGAQSAAARMKSHNNLRQFGLAMHNYHDTHGHMPGAICGKDGKPLLSWRVAILPHLEQDTLYKQFKLDEPWDSEHNKKLLAKMPKDYELPGLRRKYDVPSTHYRVFVGNGAMFDLRQKTTMAHITDGLSNTIMVVEAADAVPWTKPDELEYDPKKTPKLGYHYAGRCNVLFADGSVHTLRRSFDERMLHWLIQRADGNAVEVPD